MMISSGSKRPTPGGDVAHLSVELGASSTEHVRLQSEQTKSRYIHLVARVVAVGVPVESLPQVCIGTPFGRLVLWIHRSFLCKGLVPSDSFLIRLGAQTCHRDRLSQAPCQGPCHQRSSASAGPGESRMRGVPVERTEVASSKAGDRCGVQVCMDEDFAGVAFDGVAFIGVASAAVGASASAAALPASRTRRTFAGGPPPSSERASWGNPPDAGFCRYDTKHCLLPSSFISEYLA